jgi:hypothetical protein
VNPVPIPDELRAAWYADMRRIVVSAPSGRLDTDGSTPDEALSLEAMHGTEGRWPVFIEHWRPSDEDLEALKAGGVLRLFLYVPQMPVHSMDVARVS